MQSIKRHSQLIRESWQNKTSSSPTTVLADAVGASCSDASMVLVMSLGVQSVVAVTVSICVALLPDVHRDVVVGAISEAVVSFACLEVTMDVDAGGIVWVTTGMLAAAGICCV